MADCITRVILSWIWNLLTTVLFSVVGDAIDQADARNVSGDEEPTRRQVLFAPQNQARTGAQVSQRFSTSGEFWDVIGRHCGRQKFR